MALSAAAHHSFDTVAAGAKYNAPRGQKTDRAGEAANKAPRRQKSKAAGNAVFFELFDEDTAGVRPDDHERTTTMQVTETNYTWVSACALTLLPHKSATRMP